ncbi:MFS transporter [Nesterenkonia populi]|uniref:MFS transporter n=1 Tax=Nesterenkonia populi TaxID=1591087 RepID=UPI001FE5B76E|nr:MFS transporter [Nesterenkonia populi]
MVTGEVPVSGEGPEYSPKQVVVAIIALALGGFAIGVTEFAIMGLQREAVADLGISISQGGMLVTFYALGVVLGSPVLALLGAKRERRSFLLMLLVLFIVAHIISFFTASFELMLAARFLSGLPHGAYFAVAALMAAQMAGPAKRAKAIATVLSGLAICNVVGVPAVTWLGQMTHWRAMFLVTAVLAVVTMLAIVFFAPKQQPPEGASLSGEIRGLANARLWVGIAMGVVGFSGMFAIYAYISHIAVDVTGIAESALPVVVLLFGVGGLIGNFVGGWMSDRSVLWTALIAMVLVAVFMTAFGLFAHIPWLMVTLLVLVGISASSLGPTLQTHLIDVAPKAPQLAATFHHSAFNAANAMGAFVGGMVIDLQIGAEPLRSPAYAGAISATVGVLITCVAIRMARRGGHPV